jgi:hypothetical protein
VVTSVVFVTGRAGTGGRDGMVRMTAPAWAASSAARVGTGEVAGADVGPGTGVVRGRAWATPVTAATLVTTR